MALIRTKNSDASRYFFMRRERLDAELGEANPMTCAAGSWFIHPEFTGGTGGLSASVKCEKTFQLVNSTWTNHQGGVDPSGLENWE